MSDTTPDPAIEQAPPPLPPMEGPAPPAHAPVAKWRWLIHLLIIASYPPIIGFAPHIMEFLGFEVNWDNPEPGLSPDVFWLMINLLITMASFFVFLGLAWLASRATLDDLLMRWKPGWLPWALGLVYSIGMRLLIGVVVYIVVFAVVFGMLSSEGTPLSMESFQEASTELMEDHRPKVEHLVDTEAIVNSPIYLLLNITLVSFVMAGFREELWRSSMLAGFKGLFPSNYDKLWCRIGFVLIIAVIFGIGHYPQGIGGMILTGVLGIMLGMIMIFHRSIWQATWTHGFFNATSFVGMYFLFKYKDQFESLQKMFGAE